jgi:hypothetical protein
MTIHTRTLSAGDILTITKSMYVYSFSYTINASSSGTLLGNVTIGGVPSNAVTQSTGGATLTAGSPNSPLEGITLTCVSGTIDVILSLGL